MQEEIAELKDKNNEKRVVFCLVGVVAINIVLALSGVPTGTLAIIALFEAVLLIAIAKRSGVEWVSMLVDRMIQRVLDRLK